MTQSARVLQLTAPAQLRAELLRFGAESSLLDEWLARSTFRLLKLSNISLTVARLLYQELVMEGGLVVIPPRLEHIGNDLTGMLLCATRYQFDHLLVRLRWQPSEELNLLAAEIETALTRFDTHPPPLRIGPKEFEWGRRTYIMGILNITPDSFSGDALLSPTEPPDAAVARAVARAHELVAAGADILDIGGESTRPGAAAVDAATEQQRILPVLDELARQFDVPLSVDTYKAAVAEAALAAGARLINDVTGLRGDPDLKRVVAQARVPVILTHNWLHFPPAVRTGDVHGDIITELRAQLELALDSGITFDNLLLDPGLGFGKTPSENLNLLDRLGEFRVLGRPIVIGPSRKGFILKTLNVEEDTAEAGTAAAVACGILRGAHLVRVHNVRALSNVVRLTDALLHTRPSP